jgi:hypothetical protein
MKGIAGLGWGLKSCTLLASKWVGSKSADGILLRISA